MDRVLLTVVGANRLQAELKKLKSVERPRIIAAIAEARSHGDLSENAEYDAAKEQQAFVEGRIAELNSQLSVAEVIDPSKLNPSGKVIFGAFIELFDEQKEAKVTYQLVGDLEANLEKGQISLSSPMGKALIGKQQGDEVVVNAPAGDQIYEVLSVSYQ